MTDEQRRRDADEALRRADRYLERIVDECERRGYSNEAFSAAAYRLAERVNRARKADRQAFLVIMAGKTIAGMAHARVIERYGS